VRTSCSPCFRARWAFRSAARWAGINVEGQKEEFWQAAAGKAQYVSTLDTYAEVEYTPKTIPFYKAYQARFKKAPTYTAATYDAIMILKAAIESVGSTNADRIVEYIEKNEHVGTGSVATFDKRHDLVWAVGKTSGIAVQWQDGKKVPFWPPQVKGMQPFKMPKQ
jgi:branched-chain amino acid transport system substrate-binding protein